MARFAAIGFAGDVLVVMQVRALTVTIRSLTFRQQVTGSHSGSWSRGHHAWSWASGRVTWQKEHRGGREMVGLVSQ